MTSPVIPTILAIIGLFFALNTYTSIRRGGARHYTLEREAVLRRAMFTLMVSALAFTASVALLVTGLNQLTSPALEEAATESDVATELEATAAPVEVNSFPPTSDVTPSPFPTATTTPVVIRGMVEGTAGSGLTLRDQPDVDGEQIRVLADGEIVTILEDEPVDTNGIVWIKVRTITNEEGWVAQQYLVTRDR